MRRRGRHESLDNDMSSLQESDLCAGCANYMYLFLLVT